MSLFRARDPRGVLAVLSSSGDAGPRDHVLLMDHGSSLGRPDLPLGQFLLGPEVFGLWKLVAYRPFE